MGFRKHVRETIRLSIPITIGHLGHMLMSVTDNVMVGRIGSVPLAAAALSNVLFFLVLVFGLGVSVAITPLVAQAYGAGETKNCGLVLKQGLLVTFVFGIFLFAVTLAFAESLEYLKQPEAVIGPAKIYMKILGFSIFPMMVFQSYKQFAEGLSVTKSAMVITVLANIVNVLTNWVLIYGHLGFSPMGLTGAGFGTFFSRMFMAVAMVYVVVKSPFLGSFELSLSSFRVDMPMVRKLLAIGIPSGLQFVFEVSCFAGASVLVGWIGIRELAAHQIAFNIASISYMVSLGISAAATVRVGTALGRNDITETRMAGFSAVALITVFMTGFACFFIGLRHVLPGIYISEKDVIAIASDILVIVGIFQISDGAQAVGAGMLRGIMDMKIPTLITFAAYWLVGIPAGYVMGIRMHMGVNGVWLGLLMGLSASAVMMLFRFHRITRTKSRFFSPGNGPQ